MPQISSGALRRIHLALTVIWVVLIIPTLLWLRQSILWISLMSIYAIVVSHWGAWQAARAEVAAGPDDTTTCTCGCHTQLSQYDGGGPGTSRTAA